MWNKNDFYILQPQSDQGISLARLIRSRRPTSKVVGITYQGQVLNCTSEYDSVREVCDYKDIPQELRIIPTGAASTETLLAVRDITLGDVTLKRNALAAYDKKSFLALCERSALPIPRTYSSIEDVPNSAFPIFFKQAFEKGGGTRGIAYARDEVPAHADGTLIFQRFIDSQGTYGVGFIAQDGILLTTHTHFERESFPAAGGSAVIVETFDSPELVELTRRIVSALNYSGWGLAEFKFDPVNNEFVIMEVNAKFWASCDLAFRSNPYFAKHLFGLQVDAENIGLQFYLNRGLARGPRFIFSNLRLLYQSHRVHHPGLVRAFFYGLFPESLRTQLRNARLRMRGVR